VLIADAVDPVGRPLPLAAARKEYERSGAQVVRRTVQEDPAAAYTEFLTGAASRL
jgi:hypothetical protein